MSFIIYPPKGSRGFSLVELLVVIGIVGILSVMAIPGFKKALPQYRLKSAVRNLVGDLHRARMNAVKEHKPWGVVFDQAAGQYSVRHAGADNAWGSSDDITVQTVSLDDYGSGVQFGPGSAATDIQGDAINVSFSPISGSSSFDFNTRGFSGAGDGYCYFENDAGDAYAVGILNSGAISLRRWVGSGWE